MIKGRLDDFLKRIKSVTRSESDSSRPIHTPRPIPRILVDRPDETRSIFEQFIYNFHTGQDLTTYNAQRNVNFGTIQLICSGRDKDNPLFTYSSIGNGILISTNGYFITSNHCISEELPERKIRYHNGREYPVQRVIARSVIEDMALVKADLPGSMKPIKYRFYNTNLLRNFPVIAFSRKTGSFQTRSGIVSQINLNGNHRTTDGSPIREDNFFEIEMRSQQGDSGGVITTSEYEILGLTCFSVSRDPSVDLKYTHGIKWNRALDLISFCIQRIK